MTIDNQPFDPTTARMAQVAQRFVLLADTLVADYDVVELLDRLASDCVELIDVSAAGILLVNGNGDLDLVASSNEASRLIEVFQLESDEGPCVEATRTGQTVFYDDAVVLENRWPSFAGAMRRFGFTSVYGIPLRLRSETIGALNLFTTDDRLLSDHDRRVCQAFADVATIGILQQRSLSRVSLLSEQLQLALNSRITVEQAKGIISEYGGIDVGEAFVALRSYARANRVKLSTVATQLIARDLLPGAVTPEGTRQRR